MGKRIPKSKVNCKEGLDAKQEMQARRLRKKLLDENQREEVYSEIRKVFEGYTFGQTFTEYLKQQNPSLHSACKRINLRFGIVDRKLLINVEED